MKDLFKNYAANSNNLKWNNMIKREEKLYSRGNDIRSEFERDYTRVIHSNAYRRQKHKTQVFFNIIMIIYVQELNMLHMLNLLVIQ